MRKCSREVVFIATSPPDERGQLLKPLSEMEKIPDECEEIHFGGLLKKYTERPVSFENATLADWAAWYNNPSDKSYHKKSTKSDIDNITLETSCLACQVTTPRNEREPLQMSALPTSPWTEVSIDFGVATTGSNEYLLILIDDYSRFPVVELVGSTSAKAVIPRLDKIFSQFGIPEVLRSDNGPPFNSREFNDFSKHLGFAHRKVTPYWPRANGDVERFMRTIKKVIKAIKVAVMDGKQKLETRNVQVLTQL